MAFGAHHRVIGSHHEEVCLICTVGLMTTITVPVDYRFVSIGLGEFYFSIDMTTIADYIHPILEHGDKV